MELGRFLQLGVAVAALSACGDRDSLGGDVHPLGASGAAGSGASAGTGTSGASGSGGSGGALGGDSGGLPDEATLTLGPFPVESGRESFVCQTFANPFGASEVFIREFESHMTPGSHHLIMNAVLSPPNSLGPCSGLEPPGGPFTTQLSDDVFTYPEGVAARLVGQNLKLISHYYNTSKVPVMGEVTVTLRRARPEAVRQVALVGAMTEAEINIPPRQTQTVENGTTLEDGQEWEVFWILPHMHQHGTHFSVTAGPSAGNVIYETDRWETPWRRFDPPLRLYGGDSLNFSCTFFNATETPLTFGESIVSEEMCVLAYHYTRLDQPR